jgi:iron complex outermembrane recepter protein
MTKRIDTRIATLFCGISALALPQLALAQEAEEASERDIVVTATRDARSLQDVAMSVDVTTGDELQKLNLFDAKDIARLSPGLELTNTSGRNNTTTLRGITFDPDQGTGPAVQVYLNEVPADAQYVYTALYDIAQIEVLRGPQGTLRGVSAPAGAITVRTRRPDFDSIGGYAQVTATEKSAYNLQAGVSLPLSDQFAVRFAGLLDGNRLNHVRNVTRGERSKSRTESGRITLGWKPSDAFSAYLTYQYLHADNQQHPQVFGPGNTPIAQSPLVVGSQEIFPGFSVPIAIFLPSGNTLRSGPAAGVKDYISVAQQPSRFTNKAHIVNLALDYDLGPATVSFVGAHQYAVLNSDRDLDPGNAVVEQGFRSFVRVPNKLDTVELRVQSNNTEGFGWGAGVFYTKRSGTVQVDETANSYGAATPLAAGLFIPINTQVTVPVDNHTTSFNANLRYKTGGFTVEGGIRYSNIFNNQTTTILVTSPGGQAVVPVGGGANLIFPVGPINNTIVGVPPALQKSRAKPWTGGATASYEINPTLNVYAAYGHSFRNGTTGVATPVGITADLIRSNSEETDSFELGLKGSFADRRANFAIAAFYQKFDGYLSRFDGIFYNCPDTNGVCGAPGSAAINNATQAPDGAFSFNYNGDATVKGVELTLDGRVTNNWDFGLNLSYARSRYNNALVPCNDFAGTGTPNQTGARRVTGTGNVSYCRSDSRLAEIPDFNASFNTEVRFPVGDLTPFVRALFSHRPGFSSDRVNFDYSSRDILDAYIGLRGKDNRWEINAFARNLFNQRKITNISLGNALQGPYDSGYRTINTTNPREFGLTASIKF